MWAVGTAGTEPPLCDSGLALGTGLGWAREAGWLPRPSIWVSLPPLFPITGGVIGRKGNRLQSHTALCALNAIPVMTRNTHCNLPEPHFPSVSEWEGSMPSTFAGFRGLREMIFVQTLRTLSLTHLSPVRCFCQPVGEGLLTCGEAGMTCPE